jgi:hypothetical protein
VANVNSLQEAIFSDPHTREDIIEMIGILLFLISARMMCRPIRWPNNNSANKTGQLHRTVSRVGSNKGLGSVFQMQFSIAGQGFASRSCKQQSLSTSSERSLFYSLHHLVEPPMQ